MKKLSTSTRDNIVFIVIVIFVASGLYFLLSSRAATPALSLEPELGGLSNGATMISEPQASGSQAVRFSAGDPYTPKGLQAISGGRSVALIWTSLSSNVKSYKVYRNGSVIGTTQAKSIPEVYAQGTRFTDTTIQPGTAYLYQVQGIFTDGTLSAMSDGVRLTPPTATTPDPTITVDYTAAPDLADWINNAVVPEVKTWYPKISDKIAYPAYSPRPQLKIIIKDDPTFVVSSSAPTGEITLGAQYARTSGKDVGAAVWASAMIIQSYKPSPAWIASGVAEWSRQYVYQDHVPTNPTGAADYYVLGGSKSAYFIEWVRKQNHPNFVHDLSVGAHNGTYTSGYFKTATGKTAEQLWSSMTQKPVVTAMVKMKQYNDRCMDNTSSAVRDGNKVQVWANCAGAEDSQIWVRLGDPAGPVTVFLKEKCLDVVSSGTANGSKVQIYSCNGSGAQKWQFKTDGTIMNTNSGKCLNNPAGSGYGQQLDIQTCNARSASQLWTYPYTK